MNKVDVKVQKLHPDAVIPKYSHLFDSGFDLVAVKDEIVYPGKSVKIPVGLAFQLPEGFELQIRPRSGISDKTKLRISNAPGTIDAGYRGEVQILVDNISQVHDERLAPCLKVDRTDYDGVYKDSGIYMIQKGDRIAQGVITPVYQAQFEVVDKLDETERGIGGFGSTGVKV